MRPEPNVAAIATAVSRRALLGFAAVALIAALSRESAQAQSPFYTALPQEIAGRPGTLIRREAIDGPGGASAWRILYRSRGLRGEPIAVSGVVVVPDRAPEAGQRPVIAWAHPTSGVVPRCAPSLAHGVFQQIPGLRQMIERGYVVVATDYPGLGTPGPHPYLIGPSEGRAVLDSVRAVRTMPSAGAGNRFAVWGHSQGGQAVLYAGLLARSYAPEIALVGVAAAAPATDLATLMRDDFNTPGGKSLTAMALWSWSRLYNLRTDAVVVPSATASVDALANECIESILDILARRRSEAPLERAFLRVPDITRVEPWRSLLARNSPGPLPRGVPVLLVQGTADEVVRPQVTAAYMRRLCAAGVRARFLQVPGIGHGFIAHHAAADAVAWMADRFAGGAAPSDCPAR